MSAQTQKVDVLGVIDGEIADIANTSCSDDAGERRLRERERKLRRVRFAVSGMIEAIDLLHEIYELYEDGDPVHDLADEDGGTIGVAMNLPDELEDRIIALLNDFKPRKDSIGEVADLSGDAA